MAQDPIEKGTVPSKVRFLRKPEQNWRVKMKKVLETKVRFLRNPLSWPITTAFLRTKVSWLRNRCIWLVAAACQAFARVNGLAKVSRLRMQSGGAAIGLGQADKVRFLRTTVLVTHCTFVIYNKVSLAY